MTSAATSARGRRSVNSATGAGRSASKSSRRSSASPAGGAFRRPASGRTSATTRAGSSRTVVRPPSRPRSRAAPTTPAGDLPKGRRPSYVTVTFVAAPARRFGPTGRRVASRAPAAGSRAEVHVTPAPRTFRTLRPRSRSSSSGRAARLGPETAQSSVQFAVDSPTSTRVGPSTTTGDDPEVDSSRSSLRKSSPPPGRPRNVHEPRPASPDLSGPVRRPAGPSGSTPAGKSSVNEEASTGGNPRANFRPFDPGLAWSSHSTVVTTRSPAAPGRRQQGLPGGARRDLAAAVSCPHHGRGPRGKGHVAGALARRLDHEPGTAGEQPAFPRARVARLQEFRARPGPPAARPGGRAPDESVEGVGRQPSQFGPGREPLVDPPRGDAEREHRGGVGAAAARGTSPASNPQRATPLRSVRRLMTRTPRAGAARTGTSRGRGPLREAD